jgi:hypothetical protein
MSPQHIEQADLAAYVMGETDAVDLEALFAHVAACDECMDRLADEARLELALHEVAERAPRPAAPLVHPPLPRVEAPLLSAEPPRRPPVLLPALLAGTAVAVLIAFGVVKVNGGPASPEGESAPVAIAAPPPPPPAPPEAPPALAAEDKALLSVNAKPWARVLLDGEDVGVTPLRLSVNAGRYEMVLVDRGEHERKKIAVRVAPGERRSVAHNFNRDRVAERSAELAETGELDVRAFPYATIYVGEERLGTTPMRPLRLKVGRHKIRLENPTLGTHERVVQVERGKTLRLKVDMRGDDAERKASTQ